MRTQNYEKIFSKMMRRDGAEKWWILPSGQLISTSEDGEYVFLDFLLFVDAKPIVGLRGKIWPASSVPGDGMDVAAITDDRLLVFLEKDAEYISPKKKTSPGFSFLMFSKNSEGGQLIVASDNTSGSFCRLKVSSKHTLALLGIAKTLIDAFCPKTCQCAEAVVGCDDLDRDVPTMQSEKEDPECDE